MTRARQVELRISEIPWIDAVPRHWEQTQFRAAFSPKKVKNTGMLEDHLLSLSYGSIVPRDIASSDGLVPESYETYQIVDTDDIIFRFTDLQNDKRSLRSARVTERGIITSAYMAVTPVNIEARYAEYLMRSYDLAKVFYGLGGGVRQTLKFSDVALLPVLLPPFDEQQAIADFLDRETQRIDELIAEQRGLIETLRERRRAVLDDAFLRQANQVRTLRRLLDVSITGPFGTQLQAGEYVNDGVPVVNPTHIVRSRIRPDMSVTLTPVKARELERFRLRQGDVVLGRKGEVDKAAIVSRKEEGYICGSDSMALRPSASIYGEYLWWYLQSPSAHRQLEEWSVGSTVAGLNQRTIARLEVPTADLNCQLEISARLVDQTSRIDALIAESEDLIALSKERRAALITAAVTGQIDVRTAA